MKKFWFACIFLIVTNSAYSSKNTFYAPLHIQTLVHDVLERNPNLAAAQARVKAAMHTIPRVQALDDPIFTLRAINNSFDSKILPPPQHRYKLTQTFPFPGKLKLKGEIARHRAAFFEFEETATAQDLVLGTKQLYFQLLFNHLAQQVNHENKTIALRLVNSALAKYKSGKGNQAHVLKAQTEVQMLDDHFLTLEDEKISTQALINVILDKPQENILGTPETVFSPQINVEHALLEAIAIQKRPELKGLQALVDEQYAYARLARRNYYPDITMTFMIQNLPNQNKSAWGIDFGFNIPLWINQKQKQEKKEAEALALSHERSYYGLESKIKGKIKEFVSKLDTLGERISLYQTSLIPTLINTYIAQEIQYRTGNQEFMILLDTLQKLHTTELNLAQARINREITIAQLEKEIGVPLQKFLSPIPLFKKRENQFFLNRMVVNNEAK